MRYGNIIIIVSFIILCNFIQRNSEEDDEEKMNARRHKGVVEGGDFDLLP